MKIAVCYYSRHHGNTRKVLEAMAEQCPMDLIDVTARAMVRLEDYDVIGFASGIYYGKSHDTVVNFAKQYLPQGKQVFFVATHGAKSADGTAEIAAAVQEKDATVLGGFHCRGYDTFGPFGWIGGIAKHHPDEKDLACAQEFIRTICG